MRKRKLKEEDFENICQLYSNNSWMIEKENELLELLSLCRTDERKALIFELLSNFKFLDDNNFDYYIKSIVKYIVEDSGFDENLVQISALTKDEDADSSQAIINYIKGDLNKTGWNHFLLVNKFGSVFKQFNNEGRTQIILLDEFIGSGSTALNRIKELENGIPSNFELKFCFIAGMREGIKVVKDAGYDIFCPLIMENYLNNREDARDILRKLEHKLLIKVDCLDFKKYSLGYNQVEALYSAEKIMNNTPNSVFPIFWWPKLKNGQRRNTLFARYERAISNCLK